MAHARKPPQLGKDESVWLADIAVSPDHRWVAGADIAETTCLWEYSRAGKLRLAHTLATGGGAFLTFSPDSTRLALANRENTITLWDTRTGTKVRTLSLPSRNVTALLWSLDGNFLLSGYDDGTLARWRIK